MIRQLRKVGNSQALILDKALLDLLGLPDGGSVQVTASNGSLIVTPVRPNGVDEGRFDEALRQVLKSRHILLKRMSQ